MFSAHIIADVQTPHVHQHLESQAVQSHAEALPKHNELTHNIDCRPHCRWTLRPWQGDILSFALLPLLPLQLHDWCITCARQAAGPVLLASLPKALAAVSVAGGYSSMLVSTMNMPCSDIIDMMSAWL